MEKKQVSKWGTPTKTYNNINIKSEKLHWICLYVFYIRQRLIQLIS